MALQCGIGDADDRFVTTAHTLPHEPVPAALPACTAAEASEFERILHERDLRPVYQPILDLGTTVPVAYESLIRGPVGSALEYPDRLFGVAGAVGRLHDLDLVCQTLAISHAHDRLARTGQTLFVNVEPSVINGASPRRDFADQPGLAEVLRTAVHRNPITLEIAERDIFHQPAQLLAAVDWARRHGFSIAVDDVGVNPRSLALLPLLDPDVIKLDKSILHNTPDTETGLVLNAVHAQSERTGALIVAEGIETEEHRQLAISMGATLGQGFGLGRPGPLPADAIERHQPMASSCGLGHHDPAAPFDLVANSPTLVGSKELLLALSHNLERQALNTGDAPVLISAFQEGFRFGGPTRRRYERIAEHAAFVGAVGTDLAASPATGVHGGTLERTDPVAQEWTVLVLSPHLSCGLIARDLGDSGPELQRRFAYTVTHDRHMVTAAARCLVSRISTTSLG